MKILQIIPSFDLGGAEVMCRTLSVELKKRGHEVYVISLYDTHTVLTEQLEAQGCAVSYLGKKPGLDPSIKSKIRKIVRQVSPDVIHTHLHAIVYAPVFGVRARRVHTIHNMAGKDTSRPGVAINRFLFRHCHVTPVALSQEVKKSVSALYGLPESQIPAVFNGVPLEQCVPKTSYEAKDDFVLIHVARFSEQKNHLGLIEGFRLALAEEPRLRLLLVGDGELRPAVESRIQALGLGEKVSLLGKRDDVFPLLHEA